MSSSWRSIVFLLVVSRAPGLSAVKISNATSDNGMSFNTRSAIEWAAGGYLNAERAHAANSTRILLVTTANTGYLTMLLSWMCRSRELGLKFTIHAQDLKLFRTLSAQSSETNSFVGGFSTFYEPWLSGTGDFQSFGGKQYIHSTLLKAHIVRLILEQFAGQFHVWLSDPDVAFFFDPIPWFAYGSQCDLQFQINEKLGQNGLQRILAGDPFNSGAGGNSGFVLWRGTALSIKVAAAVSEECTRASSLAKAMYSGDQAATWHVINAIRRGDRETQLGLRLPVIKTKTHLEMADWRNNLFFDTHDLGILSTENPNESSFHLCPLPMLTHPSGSYFKSDVYSRAVKAAGIEISKLKEMVNLSREVHPPGVVIAHANFIQGSRLKRLALIRLAARSWALSKDWKEPPAHAPAGTGLNWPEQPCRGVAEGGVPL